MRILIFRPNKNWQHIGGAIVVIARDIDHAQQLVIDYEKAQWGYNRAYTPEYSVLAYTDPDDDQDCWVLHESFPAPTNEQPRIVLYNMNDG